MITLFKYILNYFFQDPLRILTLLGGSGGIVYWISFYRNRTRLHIRLLNLGLDTGISPKEVKIIFEAVNIGNMPTSLESKITLKGFIPRVMLKEPKIEKRQYSYTIKTIDRNLPPHVPKEFEAICSQSDDVRPFLWFMTYTFRLSRGRTQRIRVLSADGKILLFCKFKIVLILFRISESNFLRKRNFFTSIAKGRWWLP